MDCTEIYNVIKTNALVSGASIEHIESKETLYYDETGNVKHLVLKGGSLNAESNTVFVLGGIQAEDSISLDELKSKLGKLPTTELKAKNDLKGDFITILRKDNFSQILELIKEKKWHIHFNAIHILYYGFVDIIDSIKGTDLCPFELKAELYQVLKRDFIKTIKHFERYKYPNIKSAEKEDFLNGIINMIDENIGELASKNSINVLLMLLKMLFEVSRKQKDLPFIQEEDTNIWVKPFIQFYRQEILQFNRKKLIFDEEKQVHAKLKKEELKIDGKLLTNYDFVNSKANAMIQVSDYVVSIIRKNIIFLDRTQPEVEKDIMTFDETQMKNYKLLNFVLKESLYYNPLYLNFTISIYTYRKFMKFLNEYSDIKNI